MRFTIVNNLPYLVSHGVVYPVEILKEGRGYKVTYDKSAGKTADSPGTYSLMEVVAKCEKLTSIKPRRSKKKAEE